jgi:hypothetical protein
MSHDTFNLFANTKFAIHKIKAQYVGNKAMLEIGTGNSNLVAMAQGNPTVLAMAV